MKLLKFPDLIDPKALIAKIWIPIKVIKHSDVRHCHNTSKKPPNSGTIGEYESKKDKLKRTAAKATPTDGGNSAKSQSGKRKKRQLRLTYSGVPNISVGHNKSVGRYFS